MTLADVLHLTQQCSSTYIDATCLPNEFAVTTSYKGNTVVYYFKGTYGSKNAPIVRRVEKQKTRNSRGTLMPKEVHYRGSGLDGGEIFNPLAKKPSYSTQGRRVESRSTVKA